MRNKSRGLLLSVFIAVCLAASAGCLKKTGVNPVEEGKISVYTSIYPMYDFAKKIGGDKIKVTNLVTAGTDPHSWEPTARDIVQLEEADVLIYNGAGMEGWIEKVLNSLNNDSLVVIEAAKGLSLIENTHDHGEEENLKYDPHVWLDPMMAKKQMEAIKNGLVAADPANKDYYEQNFIDYAKKLDELDQEFKDAVAKFNTKDIVVSHEAFGYLCRAYGLRQIGIEGVNAESEPTPGKMAEIIKFCRENNVKTIFFEELISPKLAKAIADEVGAEIAVLNPLGGLSREDLNAGKEYFSIMMENLKALEKGLK